MFSPLHRNDFVHTVKNRIENGDKPDYALVVNTLGVGEWIIPYLDSAGVKTILFNSPLTIQEYAKLGRPRERHPYWIGELIPDDVSASYELARHLVDEAEARKPGGPHRMIAYSGAPFSTASTAREEGLRRALSESPNVELLQSTPARWAHTVAREKHALMSNRYDEIDIVWAANDEMALGVLEALDGVADGDLPLIGGFDWVPEAIDAIRAGRMTATMGGHFIDIAHALELVREHADGNDFAQDRGVTLVSRLCLISRANLDTHDLDLGCTRPLSNAPSPQNAQQDAAPL